MNKYGVPPVFRQNRNIPFNQREWFKRSVINHRHDKTGVFLKGVPRECPGVEDGRLEWKELSAIIVCGVGFVVLVGWGML